MTNDLHADGERPVALSTSDRPRSEATLDDTIESSFPASDPPSSIPDPVGGARSLPQAPLPEALEEPAGSCDVCGNVYDKSFEVRAGGSVYTFDCFECAIHRLAPECAHCHCRIIGHGTEAGGAIYCSAHCARRAGVSGPVDRV